MKRFFCIVFIIYSIASIAQNENRNIDSLQLKLERSIGKEWASTAIALSSELFTQKPSSSESLLNEAIQYCIENNYDLLLAQAYQIKGHRSYEKNKVLTGITYFQKAHLIYEKRNFNTESINSLIGIANGLSRIKKNSESIDTLNHLLDVYKDSLTITKKSFVYQLISENYYEQGNNLIAIKYLDSSAYIEKENELLSDLANTYNSIGIIYNDIGDYKNAIYYYDQCEELANEIQDSILVSYMLHNKAIIYYQWGVFDEALDLFLKSKDLSLKLGRTEELPLSYSSIALIYHELEDFQKAKQYYLESIRLSIENDDMETKTVSLHNLGELMLKQNRTDTALKLLNQSLKYEMEMQNTLGIAQSKSMIASVYVDLNKFPLAFEYFSDAETVFKKFGSRSDLASLYVEMGKAHSILNNDSLSVSYLKKGLEISEQIDDVPTIMDAYKFISENYERMLDFENALFYYKLYEQLNDSIFDENATKRIDYLGLRIEKQEKEKQLEQLESEQKLLKAEKETRSIQLITAISISILVIIFFSIMYIIIKRSENKTKQQYQVLRESEQKIKALLDASFDSTLLVDKNGIVKAANNNNLSGFLPENPNLINKPILSLFDDTNQKVLSKYIELVYSSKLYKELKIYDKNHIILNLKISPVQNIIGEVVSLAFYIQDITQIESDKLEKKKMEEQLIHTQKMETVGTLAGGIAHDFNNYLATIKGYVGMSLEDSAEESNLYSYLSKAMKAINLSQETVKKLLTFSRSKEMEFNKFRLTELITDSIDIVKGSKPRNVQFNYNVLSNNIELLGEKNQLTQVILNICTNAFHAIEAEKGGEVSLQIDEPKKIEDLNNKLCICIKISDNGIGMKKETLKRIFEPFFTTKDVGKGTGLGLSVVTGIINQHGGKIEVDSVFGYGTKFYLYLPIIS